MPSNRPTSVLTPTMFYHQALDAGDYQPDAVQRQTVEALTVIQQALIERERSTPVAESRGLRGRLQSLLGKPAAKPHEPVQGLYMWGGVGRGKTWLMDLFFHSIPSERKLRLHFHRFMLRVQEELVALQGQENPLEIIADGFKKEADVLCFDEFFVSDITDAMLLGTLLQALFARGITLVSTSNIPPDNLYHNGLQRARFLPAIDLIKRYCTVMNVDAGIDYRLRTLTQAGLYFTPMTTETRQRMDEMFAKLAGSVGEINPVLEINHRPLPALCSSGGVLAVEFAVLCKEARSQLDYIALSRRYHTVFLHHVKKMDTLNENTARRFLALVDEFYERHVKLIISAELSMFEIYQGDHLKFEYQRCLSRLQEMQSEDYLRLEHLP